MSGLIPLGWLWRDLFLLNDGDLATLFLSPGQQQVLKRWRIDASQVASRARALLLYLKVKLHLYSGDIDLRVTSNVSTNYLNDSKCTSASPSMKRIPYYQRRPRYGSSYATNLDSLFDACNALNYIKHGDAVQTAEIEWVSIPIFLGLFHRTT